MGIANSDEFVIMTSDSRRINTYCYVDDLSQVDEFEEIITENNKKTVQLSNGVLFGLSGIAQIGDEVRERLVGRTKPHYTIEDCELVLSEIMNDLHSRIPKDKNAKKDFHLRFLESSTGFHCSLMGFDKKQRTRSVSFCSGADRKLSSVTIPKDRMLWGFLAPSEDLLSNAKNFFKDIIPEETPLGTYFNHLIKVHTIISFLHPREVSQDCNYKVIIKENDRYQTLEGVISTEEYYNLLPPKEDMKAQFFS